MIDIEKELADLQAENALTIAELMSYGQQPTNLGQRYQVMLLEALLGDDAKFVRREFELWARDQLAIAVSNARKQALVTGRRPHESRDRR
jgi:hypothetical protein